MGFSPTETALSVSSVLPCRRHWLVALQGCKPVCGSSSSDPYGRPGSQASGWAGESLPVLVPQETQIGAWWGKTTEGESCPALGTCGVGFSTSHRGGVPGLKGAAWSQGTNPLSRGPAAAACLLPSSWHLRERGASYVPALPGTGNRGPSQCYSHPSLLPGRLKQLNDLLLPPQADEWRALRPSRPRPHLQQLVSSLFPPLCVEHSSLEMASSSATHCLRRARQQPEGKSLHKDPLLHHGVRVREAGPQRLRGLLRATLGNWQ